MINILLEHVPLDDLSEQDRVDIAKFRETSIEVDKVVSAERNRARRDFSAADVENAIDALRAMEHTDPAAYRRLAAKLRGVLALPSS